VRIDNLVNAKTLSIIGFRVPFSKPLITKSTAAFWWVGLPLVEPVVVPFDRDDLSNEVEYGNSRDLIA
jgi:hypothetical protein